MRKPSRTPRTPQPRIPRTEPPDREGAVWVLAGASVAVAGLLWVLGAPWWVVSAAGAAVWGLVVLVDLDEEEGR